MKTLIKKIEDLMVAVTFAEAGEYDEANRHSSMEQNDLVDAQDALHQEAVLKSAIK